MRGVEAPFQLMVSVFAMMLIMIIAFQVWQQAQEKKCDDMWREQLRDFALALKHVASGAPPTQESVRLSLSCKGGEEHNIVLMESDNPNLCMQVCNVAADRCYLLKDVVTAKRAGKEVIESVIVVCADISPVTYARLGGGTCYGAYPNQVGRDLKEGLSLRGPMASFLIKHTEDGIAVCMR